MNKPACPPNDSIEPKSSADACSGAGGSNQAPEQNVTEKTSTCAVPSSFPDTSPSTNSSGVFLGHFWCESRDGDPTAFACYRRHYSSRKNTHPKIRQFVGPGEKMVLIGLLCSALFAWRRFIDDSGQVGVNCAVFRNESPHRSSDMIREAMLWAWKRWPGQRLYTTVDADATAGRRSKRHSAGHCFLAAGWRVCGATKRGLVILEAINVH